MSTTQPDDRRPVSELLAMDESEAKQTLSWAEYQRYESLTEHHDRADENRADLDAADEQVHGLIARTDVSDLAADVDVFGNELVCYYGPEDEPVQDAAQRLADIFDADPSDPEGSIDTEDVSDDDLAAAKDALADLLFAAVIEWNGEAWGEIPEAGRDGVKEQITQPRPEGWGIAGLLDAWATVQAAVEEKRTERMDVVRKFRDETRTRGSLKCWTKPASGHTASSGANSRSGSNA